MTLTDPRDALADQSNFIDYLVGLAGLARIIDGLAADSNRRDAAPVDSDEFVYFLLGLASAGAAVERLAKPPAVQQNPITQASATPVRRWLR